MSTPEIQAGFIDQETDDRIQCMAMERDISREELVGRALGVGLTILEVASSIDNAKIWVFDGHKNGQKITLPE